MTPDELTTLKNKFSKLTDAEKDYVTGITAAVVFTSKINAEQTGKEGEKDA